MKKIVLSLLLVFTLIPIVPSNTASADGHPQQQCDYATVSQPPVATPAEAPDPPSLPIDSDDSLINQIGAAIGYILGISIGIGIFACAFCSFCFCC